MITWFNITLWMKSYRELKFCLNWIFIKVYTIAICLIKIISTQSNHIASHFKDSMLPIYPVYFCEPLPTTINSPLLLRYESKKVFNVVTSAWKILLPWYRCFFVDCCLEWLIVLQAFREDMGSNQKRVEVQSLFYGLIQG